MKKILLSGVLITLAGCGGVNKDYLRQQNNYRLRVSDFFKGNSLSRVLDSNPGMYHISYDSLENNYFIAPQYIPRIYNTEGKCGSLELNPYLALYNKEASMRFRMNYEDNNWLFIKSLKFYTKEKSYAYDFKYGAIKSNADATGGSMSTSEKIDTNHYKIIDIIKDITYNTSITLRLYGEKTCTYNITGASLKNLRNIKKLYDEAKNKY